MAFDYSEIADVADEILEEFGQAVTLKHVIPGEYVPGEGIVNTLSLQYGTGAIVDWESKFIDGSLIKIGDRLLLLSPFSIAKTALTAPVLGDTVTDVKGVVYTIVPPIKPTDPAGTAVLYELNLRV